MPVTEHIRIDHKQGVTCTYINIMNTNKREKEQIYRVYKEGGEVVRLFSFEAVLFN